LREVLRIALAHFLVLDLLAQDLAANRVHVQARGDVGVVWVFFDQGARCHDGRLVNLVDRHAVIEIALGLGHDGLGLDIGAQTGAGLLNQAVQTVEVERDALAAVCDVQRRLGGSRLAGLAGALLGAFLAVEHIGARDFVVSAAHQAQFHLILHVFNMEGAPARARAQQSADHGLGQLVDGFAHAGRGCALRAVNGQEGLHHGHRDLVGLKRHHGAVAPDDLVVGIDRGLNALDR